MLAVLLVAAVPARAATPYDEAISVFAIEAPRVRAMLEQGFAAEIGHGQVRSPLRAAMLYCDAAREGSIEANFRLARLFMSGDGIQKNLPIAATLLVSAAERGHEKAQAMLGLTGMREYRLPECLTDPEKAWEEYGTAGYIDIERLTAALPKDRQPVVALLRKLAPGFQVDTRFALAIAAVESNFNPQAVSPKNAMGVMQLIPDTASRFNVKNALHPEQNIRGGLAYLRWLLQRFNGDITLVAAAYNAGEGAVDRHGGIPPYAETQAYVRRVQRFMPPPSLNEVRRAVRGGLPY